MNHEMRALRLAAVMLIFLISATAHAASVTLTASSSGGNLFQYSLVINSTESDPPISGLNVLKAGSVFDLTPSSIIMTPPGWDFFPPDPTVDELNFFSLNNVTDAPPGGSLGGFTFQSMTDPSTLGPDDFQYDLISGPTGNQIPEPTTPLLLATGLAGIGIRICKRRKAQEA
jgi:PEP-CTERM motif